MIYRKYTISDFDTLQSIAHTQLGDIAQWITLKDFNDLRYPYIVSPEQKIEDPIHFVTIGDTIMIPIADNLSDVDPSTLPKASQQRIYDMALGMDIKMGHDKKDSYHTENGGSDNLLEMLPNDNRRDIGSVMGPDNLVQALKFRLLTARGTLLYHPDYGSLIDTYIGQKLSDSLASAIDVEIENTIRRDSRVSNVIVGNHQIQNNVYSNTFTVQPISLEDAFQLVINGSQNNGISIATFA